MNIEELQLICAIVFAVAFVAIPVFAAIRNAREERYRIELEFLVSAGKAETLEYGTDWLKAHTDRVTTAPMSPEEIEKIDFGPAAYYTAVPANYSGEYNVVVGYTDADGRVPESPVMIGGVICEHCGRINSRESYYCDGCRASIYESQARADRIALRY